MEEVNWSVRQQECWVWVVKVAQEETIMAQTQAVELTALAQPLVATEPLPLLEPMVLLQLLEPMVLLQLLEAMALLQLLEATALLQLLGAIVLLQLLDPLVCKQLLIQCLLKVAFLYDQCSLIVISC